MKSNTVKPALTSNRRSRRRDVVENDDYAAFARRILAAYGRRVAQGDVEALRALINLGRDIEQATDTAVTGLRAHGYSWTEIADRLGISRQAAHQRWGGTS
jgi:DNA-directed RNA polymerase specialized sigma24 family protein